MGTFIVGAILVVIVFFIVRSLVQRIKNGHGFCAYGDCKSCGHCTTESQPQCNGNCGSCGKCGK